MSRRYIPEKGDIIWLDLNPRTGREQSGLRPALVLSPRLLAESIGLAVICPITTKVKGLLFEVPLESCKTVGAVLPIHLRSVDIAARKVRFIEKAPATVMRAVDTRVGLIVGGTS